MNIYWDFVWGEIWGSVGSVGKKIIFVHCGLYVVCEKSVRARGWGICSSLHFEAKNRISSFYKYFSSLFH